MATPGELAKTLSDALRIPLGTVKFYGNALRAAGLLASKGRGTSAATMTARDAAAWLIALCVADSAPKAAAMTTTASNLSLVEIDGNVSDPDATVYEIPCLRRDALFREGKYVGGDVKAMVEVEPDLISTLESLISECIRLRLFPDSNISLPMGHIEFAPGAGHVSVVFYMGGAERVGMLFATPAVDFEAKFKTKPLDNEAPISLLIRLAQVDMGIFAWLASCLADEETWRTRPAEFFSVKAQGARQ